MLSINFKAWIILRDFTDQLLSSYSSKLGDFSKLISIFLMVLNKIKLIK